jgi:uncharacterized membrane-anchored protein YjiN (DUF445 family)
MSVLGWISSHTSRKLSEQMIIDCIDSKLIREHVLKIVDGSIDQQLHDIMYNSDRVQEIVNEQIRKEFITVLKSDDVRKQIAKMICKKIDRIVGSTTEEQE